MSVVPPNQLVRIDFVNWFDLEHAVRISLFRSNLFITTSFNQLANLPYIDVLLFVSLNHLFVPK